MLAIPKKPRKPYKKRQLVFIKVTDRNMEILRMWREGNTLQYIALRYSITRERVRQIVNKTIKQLAVNETLLKGIDIDYGVIIEEEIKKRSSIKISKRAIKNLVAGVRRWSRFYSACRSCGTVAIPHVRHGLCERCSGQYRDKRRKEIIERHSNCCNKCGISQVDAVNKYGRDLYITKSQQVLCRSCFLKITGEKLGHRIRLNKQQD